MRESSKTTFNPVLVSDEGCVAIDALIGTYGVTKEAT